MQKLLKDYLDEIGRKQRKRRRAGIAAALVAVMVVGTVIWSLAQAGIAMTGEPKCGLEEHEHTEACYEDAIICGMEESAGHTHTEECYQTPEPTLICGQEESEEHTHTEECYQTAEPVLICGQEEGEGHTHIEACHGQQLICGKEEHKHTDACFIDTSADVEEADLWDAQYADTEWKEGWGENLVVVAEKQIGYKESEKNYTIAEDGSHKGYTRYGQFAMNAGTEGADVYADWDAAFVNFCMHYAGIEESQMFPNKVKTDKWYEEFITVEEGKNQVYVTSPEGYEPQAGDIIFFHKENEETETQMGIVSSCDKEKNEIKVIEGNSGNAVKENKYQADNNHISAYLKVTELEQAYKNLAAEEQKPKETASIAELNYEDEEIIVRVTAEEEENIPQGAGLSVVPVVADDQETTEKYQEVEAKIQEKAESEEYDIVGFRAYDISFTDAEGNKLEPNGKVNVSMKYKNPELPPEVAKEDADTEVRVLHLEENESGEVTQVVDMSSEELAAVDTLATTEGEKVRSVEVETESFSTFTIIWTLKNDAIQAQQIVKLVDTNGIGIIENNIELKLPPEKKGVKIPIGDLVQHLNEYANGYTFQYATVRNWNDSRRVYFIRSSGVDDTNAVRYYTDPTGTEQHTMSDKALYLVYQKDNAGTGDPQPPVEDDNIWHSKYIDYLDGSNAQTELNGSNYYRLYLDVKGIPNEPPEPADILLILDRSSSMGSTLGDSNRWAYVKSSAKLVVDTLLPDNVPAAESNKIGIAWFDADAFKYETDFTSSKTELTQAIEQRTMGNGTNYQAAFLNAQDMLKNVENDGRKKYVVFVTDGRPSCYYKDNKVCWETDEDIVEQSITAAKGFKNFNLEGFYAISLGSTSGDKFLREDIVPVVGNCNKRVVAATSPDEVRAIFDEIVSSVSKRINHVKIRDSLSNYVNFVSESGGSLAKYDTDGDGMILGVAGDDLSSELGLKVNSYTCNSNEEVYKIHGEITSAEEYPSGESLEGYTYRIDLTNKTIEVDFGNTFLERNVVYTISFNVTLTDAATEEALETQKTSGDAHTDYPGNDTSSNKPGLFSNSEATLTYTKDGEEKEPLVYDKPVVQPKRKLEIVKKSSTEGDSGLEGATFTLTKKVDIPDVVDEINGESVSDGTANVINGTSNSKGVIVWDSAIEKADGTYTLKEVTAPLGYLLSEIKWEITFNEGFFVSVKQDGTDVMKDSIRNSAGIATYIYVFENDPSFALPETGGSGIYLYMFSGVLLMAGAVLMTYKNKQRRKGVLRS